MPSSITTRSRTERVYDQLLDLIRDSDLAVGDRLQPIRHLSKRFDASVPTVQRAMTQLETEGWLVRRQGAGTFVARPGSGPNPASNVTLLIEVGSDVFGELAGQILQRVQANNGVVTLLDSRHGTAADLLAGLSQTSFGPVVVHGHVHFRFDILTTPTCRNRPVVGVVDWESDWAPTNLTQVLTDHAEGARLLTQHLWDLGYRHILVVGSPTQVRDFLRLDLPGRQPYLVHDAWARLGGSWSAVPSTLLPDETVVFDWAQVQALLDDAPSPPAVLGLRDFEAHALQRLLRQRDPARAACTAVVGYFDTPWSTAGDPPITSINLNVAELARVTADVLAALHAGRQPEPACTRVAPSLKVRASSIPAPGA